MRLWLSASDGQTSHSMRVKATATMTKQQQKKHQRFWGAKMM